MQATETRAKIGMKSILIIASSISVFLPGFLYAADLPQELLAEEQNVADYYHGVKVTEDYRWLEDFGDPAVKKWSDAQNSYARDFLDSIPERESIKKRMDELMLERSSDYYSLKYRDHILFAIKSQPPMEQPLLITLDSADDPETEKVIVDVNRMNPEATTSIDFYVPSHDGKLVAVSLSEKGSEIGTVYIFEVATGNRLSDTIPRVNGPTAGGDVAWNIDGSGFYYTRYPRKGERPEEDMSFFQQVYYHKLGTPTEEDEYSIGEEFPRIAEIELESSEDGQYFLATVANGDGGEFAHYLLDETGRWTQITHFEDMIPTAAFGPDNSVYMLSLNEAPRGKIIHLKPGETDLSKAATLIEEGDLVIQYFLPTRNFIYLVYLDGGPTKLKVINLDGARQRGIPFDPNVSIRGLMSLGTDTILFRASSYTNPPGWYRFDPSAWETSETSLFMTSPADFNNIEVVREFATSKDGTRVPLNIIRRKGIKLDGRNPTILNGYGGYGISLSPDFDASRQLWLDHGGVYVIANLRGGGEYGEEWHRAGNLTNKQNVFDDFIACAEYLIEDNYTNPSKLAIEGGSNGGLLMGAAFTQKPELFGAVVSSVGIYDMLRVELDPNGMFNTTEFGTVKNPDHFKALYAYSPYHNVRDGTEYPPILFLTGEHDGRVNPAQSRKMTARLQAATGSDNPILLRTSSSTGHGQGTALSERIERESDIYAFIFNQLDTDFRGAK
jgi:prolyl oligopeptidase